MGSGNPWKRERSTSEALWPFPALTPFSCPCSLRVPCTCLAVSQTSRACPASGLADRMGVMLVAKESCVVLQWVLRCPRKPLVFETYFCTGIVLHHSTSPH